MAALIEMGGAADEKVDDGKTDGDGLQEFDQGKRCVLFRIKEKRTRGRIARKNRLGRLAP